MTQVYDRRQKAWVPKKPKPGSPKAMLAAIESLRTALEVERHRIATLERRANEAPVASGKLVVRDPRGCPMCARHVRRVGEIVLRRFECLDPVCWHDLRGAVSDAWNLVFVWANTLEKICEVRWPKDRPVPSVGTNVDIEFWSGLARSGDMAVRVVEYRPLVRHDTDNHDRSEVHARVFVEVPRPPDVPYPRKHRGGK